MIVLIDDIYTAKRSEYVSGRFYGLEEEKATKTLLCFMIKSGCGQFQDVVSLIPMVNLKAKDIK